MGWNQLERREKMIGHIDNAKYDEMNDHDCLERRGTAAYGKMTTEVSHQLVWIGNWLWEALIKEGGIHL